ncbi:MAG: DUF1992 domain-containing protein [Desulfobacterales bacterium]
MAYIKSVEEQIKAAMARGEFDNLPGKGKPLDLETYFKTPPHLRMAFHILKGSGYLPYELTLRKEIEDLKAQREATEDDVEQKRLDTEVVQKTALYNMALERNRSVE